MIFKDILTNVYNLIDEVDLDPQIEIICKSAINESYNILCNMDNRLLRAYVPIINGVATIPNNCLKIIETKPTLDINDRIVGNNILTPRTGVIEILYNYLREPLVNDDDEPLIAEQLQYAMINYACYKYYEHRKKDTVAQMFFQNYNQVVYTFNDSSSYTEEVVRRV